MVFCRVCRHCGRHCLRCGWRRRWRWPLSGCYRLPRHAASGLDRQVRARKRLHKPAHVVIVEHLQKLVLVVRGLLRVATRQSRSGVLMKKKAPATRQAATLLRFSIPTPPPPTHTPVLQHRDTREHTCIMSVSNSMRRKSRAWDCTPVSGSSTSLQISHSNNGESGCAGISEVCPPSATEISDRRLKTNERGAVCYSTRRPGHTRRATHDNTDARLRRNIGLSQTECRQPQRISSRYSGTTQRTAHGNTGPN